MSRREEEGGEQKGRRSKTRQKTYNKLNILRGVVRGVPFRGVAWKNVTKTLRGAVLCNPACRLLCFQVMFGGMGWAERRAASSSYQTLSHFFPQHCSLHPRSPKLVCPDKKICLACLPSSRLEIGCVALARP